MNRPCSLTAPLLAFTLALALVPGAHAAPAPQGSTHLSNASQWAADGSAIVLSGALVTVAASGAVVLASVEVVGDASVVVLTSAADGVSASVRLSGQAARQASTAVGASVEVVAQSSGYMLIAAGKVLAFVPNELGRALLYSARAGADS